MTTPIDISARSARTRQATRDALGLAPPEGIVGSWGSLLLLAVGSLGHVLTHPGTWPATLGRMREVCAWTLSRGLPIVGLVVTPFGTFLAMQAYFKATFTEASGAVVILGLVRFVAPVLTSLTMVALLANRMVPDGGDGPWIGPRDAAGKAIGDGRDPRALAIDTVGWALGAGFSGLCLAALATLMAASVGCLIAGVKLAVPWMIFLGLAMEMFHPNDGLSLAVQAIFIPLAGSVLMAHECHLAARRGQTPRVFRGVLWSLLALHLINALWFQLVYLGGSPFGPRILEAGGAGFPGGGGAP